MLKARKGNVVLRIDDNSAEEYRTLGYTVTDMKGHLVAAPDNAQQRVRELEAENGQLRAENSQLRAQLAEATAEKKRQRAGTGKEKS